MSTTLGGARLDAPELPTGRIVLRAPPRLEPDEGAGGVLMNAIPMLGSLGSIVLVATTGGGTGGRGYVAAGGFLVATLGFVLVQLDRQRRQRARQVSGPRTEYLRHLGGVRRAAREAADQQRRALTWHHPDPGALPGAGRGALPGVGAPRLRRPPPARALRTARPAFVPGAGAAGGRTHRPGRPGRGDGTAPPARRAAAAARPADVDRPAGLRPGRGLRTRGTGPRPGPRHDLLGHRLPLPRAPRRRRALLGAGPRPLGLGQVAPARPERPSVRRRGADADGVAPTLAPPPDLATGRCFAPSERPATPHVLLVTDGVSLPSGAPSYHPSGRHGVTVLDLPPHGDERDDPGRLPLQLTDEAAADGRHPVLARGRRAGPCGARVDQCDLAPPPRPSRAG